jgi:hypothetical protein
MSKKMFVVLMVVFAFTICGCETRGVIVGDKEIIKSDCAPNFSIEGSPASGKIYNAFKDYPNTSKEKVFDSVLHTVSMNLQGWQVINSNKKAGTINASRGSLGNAANQSAMNLVIKRINKKVRVEISRKTPPLTYTSTDGIMQVFCKIFNSVEN